LALRRLRWNGWKIARETGLSRATVSRILRHAGMNRLRSLDPPPPVVRYKHKHPGDLVHFDIKRLARIVKAGHCIHGDRTQETRGAGYEYLHIVIEPALSKAEGAIPGWPSRPSCPIRSTPRRSASSIWPAARLFYSRFGFSVRRVLTDNGSCYRDGRFRMLLNQQHIQHRFTRPYTPRTNAPTAKRNASSKPRCANGPTPAPTRTRSNVKPNSTHGYMTTTSTAHMLASTSTRQPADQA